MRPEISVLEWRHAAGMVRVLPDRARLLEMSMGARRALWSPPTPPLGWCLGGERLWFGPEHDWFWQRLDSDDPAAYRIPPGLDPDLWTVAAARDGYFRSALRVVLRSARRKSFVSLRVERSMELLAPASMEGSIESLGLSTTTSMEILDGTPGQPVDLWSILQVPTGGRMIIPTVGAAAPRDYFKPAPEGEIDVRSGCTEIAIRGLAAFKLGMAPLQTTGRMAYVRPVDGRYLVLTRSLLVHPGLRYCDAPRHAPGTQGDALQFFCDDGTFGGFGEMEHHSPAIFCGTGPQTVTDNVLTRLHFLDESAYAAWKSEFLPIPAHP